MKMDHLDLQIKYTPAERQFLLYEYFQKHTNKEHPVSRKEILDYLETFEIYISPHTLYSDLDVLRGTMKLDIHFNAHAHKGAGGYWVKNPKFEPYELRLIVDGIQSSKFIPQKQARVITQKITDLADNYTKASLNRQAFVAGRVRSLNESVVKDADRIHEAIATDRKIAFRYFHYTPNKDNPQTYSKSGERIIVSPYALMWNDGNYYLYAYDGKKFRTYRVDRMEGISRPLLEKREGGDEYDKKNLTDQRAKVFSMYHGEAYNVRIRVHNRLADAVIDQFGKDTMMVPYDDNHFTVNVPVELSPPFYAWVATFGKSMKILSPEPAVEGMKKFLQTASEMYQDE